MTSGCVSALWRRLRRAWAPKIPVIEIPDPTGSDEDRSTVEHEKNEFAEELHHMRQRVHFLEIMTKVRQRGKDTS